MKLRIFLYLLILLISVSKVTSDGDETTEAEEASSDQESIAETSESTINTDEDSPTTAATSKSFKKSTKSTSKTSTSIHQIVTRKSDSKSEESCNPWPSNIRPLRECCYLPHNPMSVTLNTCFYRCTSREIDEKNQIECGASCFVNVTGIYYENYLNRERVKNLMIGPSMVSTKWIRVIENAIDTCRFEDRGSIHDRLARFFGCVNDFMTDNCVQFIQSSECEKTQELYEQCHRIKPICEHWPFGYGTLDSCCKIPTLFSQQLRMKCHHECTYSELFLQRQAKCDEVCRYDDTKLRIENRFNFDAIRDMLIQSSGNNTNWRSPIEHAVEKCKLSLGSNRNIRPSMIEYEITTLQTCLRDFMASECVEFRDEAICRKVKNFMKNCPEIKPRKTTHYSYSQHGYA